MSFDVFLLKFDKDEPVCELPESAFLEAIQRHDVRRRSERFYDIRLQDGSSVEVHPYLLKPHDMSPLEFDIPSAATRSGVLDLFWYAEPGLGGNGRGCQVSEVWLIKK